MKGLPLLLRRSVIVLAVLSIAAILIDSIILNFYSGELFLSSSNSSTARLLIVIDAAIIGVFILVSELWVSRIRRVKGKWSAGIILTALFGLICLFFLYQEMIIAEEITFSIILNEDYGGKLNILQFLFSIQLVYVLIILGEMTIQEKPGELQGY